eukprot:3118975-Pleurochrysis_carterae.AAC.4
MSYDTRAVDKCLAHLLHSTKAKEIPPSDIEKLIATIDGTNFPMLALYRKFTIGDSHTLIHTDTFNQVARVGYGVHGAHERSLCPSASTLSTLATKCRIVV